MSDITRSEAIDVIELIMRKYEEDECICCDITFGDEEYEALRFARDSLKNRRPYQLEYEPTTKNDLGVDKEQLRSMIRGLTKWYVKRDNTEVGEPNTAVGLLYDDVMFGIDRLPSATPQLSSELEKNSKKLEKNFGELDCISRADVNRIICEYRDDAAETGSEKDLERAYGANAVGELISELPSVTPQEPRKGEWIRMSDLSEQEDDRYKCSRCGNVIHHKNKMDLYTFNSWCGRCGSDNGRKIEVKE